MILKLWHKIILAVNSIILLTCGVGSSIIYSFGNISLCVDDNITMQQYLLGSGILFLITGVTYGILALLYIKFAKYIDIFVGYVLTLTVLVMIGWIIAGGLAFDNYIYHCYPIVNSIRVMGSVNVSCTVLTFVINLIILLDPDRCGN